MSEDVFLVELNKRIKLKKEELELKSDMSLLKEVSVKSELRELRWCRTMYNSMKGEMDEL